VFPGPRTTAAVGYLLALVIAPLVLTGCGSDPDEGTNGVGKLPPRTIERRARAAAESADAVRLFGTVVSYRLDMRLRDDGGLGHVTTKDSTFELLRVDDDLYLKAGADFYGEEVASKLKDKYVKVPSDDPAYKQFSGFTDKEVLLEDLFVLDGDLATGEYRSVGGVRTVAVTANGGNGGTLDVSLRGKPYPLRYERAGKTGTLRLTDWGKTFDLTAPKGDEVVDYGERVGSG
jgi:hypothetical protein